VIFGAKSVFQRNLKKSQEKHKKKAERIKI